MSEHLRRLRDTTEDAELYRHFRLHDARSYLRVFALEHCASRSKRLAKERLWIRRFGSLTPGGLNASPGSIPRTLNLVTYKASCANVINSAIRRACRQEDFQVRLCYRADRNLKRRLF
jgi:hypothetical protein